MLLWIEVILIGYLLGSIPPGYLISRYICGVDVRQVGSGRIGGTNVLRAAGWQAALASGLGDGLKALFAVLIARWLGGTELMAALAGGAAVVGHNYSVFLRFHGGAGTAATIGGAVALWPWNLAILPVTLFGVAFSTKHASMGSIAVAVVLPVVYALRAALGFGPWDHVAHGLIAALLTLWALRPNIGRLLRGEERVIDLQSGRNKVDTQSTA